MLLSLCKRLPLATVAGSAVAGSALRQSHHQPNMLKAINLPEFEGTRRARASQHESRAQGSRTAALWQQDKETGQCRRRWNGSPASCLSSVLVRPVKVPIMRQPGKPEYHVMTQHKRRATARRRCAENRSHEGTLCMLLSIIYTNLTRILSRVNPKSSPIAFFHRKALLLSPRVCQLSCR